MIVLKIISNTILALHHSVKHFTCSCNPLRDFPGGSVVKYLPANIGDIGLIPRLGKSPEGGNGSPLQYSCLENLMDRETWWAAVLGVTKELDMT